MVFDPAWTCEDIARELCDVLVAGGLLKQHLAFIREDREAKLAGIFERVGLDGARMEKLEHQSALAVLVRQGTDGQAWVPDVIRELAGMRPELMASASAPVSALQVPSERAPEDTHHATDPQAPNKKDAPSCGSIAGAQAPIKKDATKGVHKREPDHVPHSLPPVAHVELTVVLASGSSMAVKLPKPDGRSHTLLASIHHLHAEVKKEWPAPSGYEYRLFKGTDVLGKDTSSLEDGDVITAVVQHVAQNNFASAIKALGMEPLRAKIPRAARRR